jgi:hypothetical protein
MDVFQIFNTIKDFFILIKDWLISSNWQGIISVAKIVAIVMSALLFVGIINLIIRLNLVPRIKKAGKLLSTPSHLPRKTLKKWNKIKKRLESGQEAELKLAVIEADKFFDEVLKRCGYYGKDMGERLKQVNASQIANIDNVWDAHKVRNNVVHNADYKLSKLEAEKSIRAYKKALEEMEIL